MKCSRVTCLLLTSICQIIIAGDASELDNDARVKKTFQACMQTLRNLDTPLFPQLNGLGYSSYFTPQFQCLKECKANYAVEATAYTEQPLTNAIAHVETFSENPSANGMMVNNLKIRCIKGKFPFMRTIVTANNPLSFEYAIRIMQAVQEREVPANRQPSQQS